MQERLQRTVTAQVYEQVRASISSGELRPGARIDQGSLARRFGTSIVPIREALARLRADGLVRIVPHRGAFVEQMSRDELIDIYAIRELLEEQAARLAAGQLGEQALDRLEELALQMEAATAQQDYAALFQLNRAFHFTIYAAAGRPQLHQIIEQLWDQGDRYRRISAALPERATRALAEHHAILEAGRRRDAEALGYTMRHHIHQTSVSLLEQAQVNYSAETSAD